MADDNEEPQEISLGVTYTDNAASLTLKTRLFSAMDWLGARWVRSKAKPINEKVPLADAATRIRVALLEAAGKRAVQEVENGSLALALRTLDHFSRISVEGQAKMDDYGPMLLDNLESRPPLLEDLRTGPKELSQDFLARWRRSAEVASAEEARQLWAAVLAQEIRRPGTFSPRTLRIMDETDGPLAATFQSLCTEHRFGQGLPHAVCDALAETLEVQLVEAGLLLRPAQFGQHLPYERLKDADGQEHWAVLGDSFAIAASVQNPEQLSAREHLEKVGYGFPCYELMPSGRVIAQLFPTDELSVARRIISHETTKHPDVSYVILRREERGWVRLG